MPFEPIETQEQLDAIIAKRVKEEKALREENETLKAQLDEQAKETTRMQKEHALEWELNKRGLSEGKAGVIKRLVDLDAEEDPRDQLEDLSKQAPELFRVVRGAGSGGSKYPVLKPQEEPLSEEDIAAMSPEEMAKPSVMERIDRFMAGQR
jgi:hypothetical protein